MESTVPDKMRAWEAPEPDKGVEALQLTDSRAVAHPKEDDDANPPTVTVKIHAAALNPVDYHVLGALGGLVKAWPLVPGCDMAGVVAEVDDGAKWKVGDRVWAYTGVGGVSSGTLAEYCLVRDDVCGAVPDALSFEDAATLGLGTLTAAVGLFRHLGLQMGEGAGDGAAVLIYGASSSVGCYAVQLLKISGYRVVAVASTRNHDYLQGLGADQTVDYKDGDWVDQIAAEGANKGMCKALDAVCKDSTAKCFEAIEKCGGSGGVVATTLPNALPSEEMQGRPADALKTINLATAYYDAQRPAVVAYVAKVSEWVAAGKVKPNRVKVAGGLDAARDALQELQAGKVSAEKLVVQVCT